MIADLRARRNKSIFPRRCRPAVGGTRLSLVRRFASHRASLELTLNRHYFLMSVEPLPGQPERSQSRLWSVTSRHLRVPRSPCLVILHANMGRVVTGVWRGKSAPVWPKIGL